MKKVLFCLCVLCGVLQFGCDSNPTSSDGSSVDTLYVSRTDTLYLASDTLYINRTDTVVVNHKDTVYVNPNATPAGLLGNWVKVYFGDTRNAHDTVADVFPDTVDPSRFGWNIFTFGTNNIFINTWATTTSPPIISDTNFYQVMDGSHIFINEESVYHCLMGMGGYLSPVFNYSFVGDTLLLKSSDGEFRLKRYNRTIPHN